MRRMRFAFLPALLMVSLFFVLNGVTYARTSPNNEIEKDRKALCNTPSPINIYGAVWVNGSSTTDWSETLTVDWDATNVTAYMQTTAFMCSNASTDSRTGVRITDLTANNKPGYIPVTFNGGDTINRGTMYRGEFSSTGARNPGLPGILKVKLDVTNLGTGTYTISYKGVYQDNLSTGQSATYYTKVNLIRKGQPKTATITTSTSSDNLDSHPAVPGNQVNLGLESSNVSNVPSGDTVEWHIESKTNNGSYSKIDPARGSLSLNINPDGNSDSRRYDVPTAAGNYCWKIVVSGPSYAYINQNDNEVCFNIVSQAAFTVSTTAVKSEYEKGSGSFDFYHNILISSVPCNYTQAVGQASYSYAWSAKPTNANGIGATIVGTLQFNNCSNTINITGGSSPGSKSFTIPSGGSVLVKITDYNLSAKDLADLNSLPPGDKRGRYTTVGSASDSGYNVTIIEAPFARFFGNDVKVCGDGANNRFVFDASAKTASRFSGSFSEFASIYSSDNVANNTFAGLQSSGINTTWNKLLSNYPAFTIGNCTVGVTETKLDDTIATTSTISGSYSNSVTYYNDGNISITGDLINNSHTGATYTNAFNPDTFPIIFIYAEGDINISSTVNRIDAVLVAEGEINTCSAAKGVAVNISGICDSPLKINGAVVAKAVNLQRSGGTRYLANLNSATWNDNSLGGINNASEIIEYPWYLNFVNFKYLAKDSDTGFKAYYSLPPRL